jgi:hypothetical protein
MAVTQQNINTYVLGAFQGLLTPPPPAITSATVISTLNLKSPWFPAIQIALQQNYLPTDNLTADQLQHDNTIGEVQSAVWTSIQSSNFRDQIYGLVVGVIVAATNPPASMLPLTDQTSLSSLGLVTPQAVLGLLPKVTQALKTMTSLPPVTLSQTGFQGAKQVVDIESSVWVSLHS